MSTDPSPDDFGIAKQVYDLVKDLPHERQARVLRWVAEGTGVTSPVRAPVEPAPMERAYPSGEEPSQSSKSMTDIKTFIAAKQPKSDNQFAAAAAYFYRFEAAPAERRESINSETLREAARQAGWRRPSDPRNTLNNAKKSGLLDSAGRGEFTINSVGENLVAMTMPGGADTVAPRRGRRASGKKATAKKPAVKKKR